ncbi:alpha/beta hydrolase [Variovorax sp. YR752]|uniref:alpha/beta fold hydrolase n=1 Tax=Variovorax sp. YR752 TaxID=1884383 RepID=UPI003137B1C2
MPPALPGRLLELRGDAGRLALYLSEPPGDAASAAPLLLVHSVNAAGSSREMRPAWERYATRRPVIAVDLPGFGLSERSERAYTPRLMTDAVLCAARELQRRHGGRPIDVMALSLGCEFAARAVSEAPALFRSLALVSPTGFNGTKRRDGPPGSTRAVPGLHRVLSLPLWSRGLFSALTRPGVIRFFLEKTWGRREIDEDLWQYAVAVTRAPEARHAPLHFLGGGLFSADIHRVYESLALPVWMSHGSRGDFVDYRGKAAFTGRANWRFDPFDTGALVFFEQPDAFFARYDAFLARL